MRVGDERGRLGYFTKGIAGRCLGMWFLQILPPQAWEICYNTRRQFNSFAFIALLALSETANFLLKSRDGMNASTMGAFSFVISSRAFAGLTRNPTGNCALSFSCRPETEGTKREKLVGSIRDRRASLQQLRPLAMPF